MEYDLLRSICILWIVCVWHLINYALDYAWARSIFSSSFCYRLTIGCLSSFMFLSGMFTNKEKFITKSDVAKFYKRKFSRFYILYAIFVCTIIVSNYPPIVVFFDKGWEQIILSLLGLATITNKAPSTLWFMDLLLFFIFLTPILRHFNKACTTIFILTMWSVLLLLCKHFNLIDYRAAFYFPFYALGLQISPQQLLDSIRKHPVYIWVVSTLILVLFFSNQYMEYVDSIAWIFFLLSSSVLASKIAAKAQFLSQLIHCTSYLSLCAYLFHRQVMKLCDIFFGDYAFIIMPLAILMIAFCIQRIYDIIQSKAENHKSLSHRF